jgi:hypothetical protein
MIDMRHYQINIVLKGTQLTCSFCNSKICKVNSIAIDDPIVESNYYDWEDGQKKIRVGDPIESQKCKCGHYYLLITINFIHIFHTVEGWCSLSTLDEDTILQLVNNKDI